MLWAEVCFKKDVFHLTFTEQTPNVDLELGWVEGFCPTSLRFCVKKILKKKKKKSLNVTNMNLVASAFKLVSNNFKHHNNFHQSWTQFQFWSIYKDCYR